MQVKVNCYIIALAAILMLPQTSFCQEIQLSAAQKLNSKTPRFGVLGQNMEGIILRRYGKGNDFLDVYDRNLKFKYSKPISTRKQNSFTKKIVLNKFGATIFYITQSKNSSVLYARILKRGFAESGKDIAIDTINDNRDAVGSLSKLVMSQDKSSFLFYHPHNESESLKSIQFTVIKRDLTKVCSKQFKVKGTAPDSKLAQGVLDNELNAYFMVNANPEGEEGRDNQFTIYKYDCGEAELQRYKIPLQYPVFQKPMINMDNVNGNLLMSAFSKSDQQKGKAAATGILSVVVDADSGYIVSEHQAKFGNEFIYELTGKDTTSDQNKRLYTFQIRKVIPRRDGGAIMIAESFYKETDEISGPGGLSPTFSSYRAVNLYFYNDILVFSIGSDGNIDWASILRKKQISENDNGAFSSFGLMNTKNQLRFIYLEEIFPRSNLNEFILSGDGSLESQVLLNMDDEEVMLIPKLAKQISPREIVIPSLRKNLLSLVKLNY